MGEKNVHCFPAEHLCPLLERFGTHQHLMGNLGRLTGLLPGETYTVIAVTATRQSPATEINVAPNRLLAS